MNFIYCIFYFIGNFIKIWYKDNWIFLKQKKLQFFYTILPPLVRKWGGADKAFVTRIISMNYKFKSIIHSLQTNGSKRNVRDIRVPRRWGVKNVVMILKNIRFKNNPVGMGAIGYGRSSIQIVVCPVGTKYR